MDFFSLLIRCIAAQGVVKRAFEAPPRLHTAVSGLSRDGFFYRRPAPRAASNEWKGETPQAPRRRLATEEAQALEPVEVLLWLALVPWPVWLLVLWRVLWLVLWRVLLWQVLWL